MRAFVVLWWCVIAGVVLAQAPPELPPRPPADPPTAIGSVPGKPQPVRRAPTTLPKGACWPSVAIHPETPQSDIRTAMLSPDGRLAASSSHFTVELWNTATGALVRQLEGHTNFVNALAFAPDGKTVATASYDHTVRWWDVATGKEQRRGIGHQEGIAFLAYAPDGKTVATGGYDNVVRIWDAATAKTLHECKGHRAMILGLAYAADSQTLASCGGESTIYLWNVATGKNVGQLEGSPANVRSVVFHPDGKTLFSSCCDGTMRRWAIATRKLEDTFTGHTADVFALALNTNGTTLYSASHDGTLGMWDTATGKRVRHWPAHEGGVIGLHLRADDRVLLSGGYDKTLRLWDTATGQERLTFDQRRTQHEASVNSVVCSPDGVLTASADSHGRVLIRNTRTGDVLRQWQDATMNPPPMSALAFHPTKRELLGVTHDGTLVVWDFATGQQRQQIAISNHLLYALAIAPDGATIAVAGRRGGIHLLDATFKERAVLRGHTTNVIALQFNTAGDRLLSASHDGTARLWNTTTGKLLTTFEHEQPLYDARLAPDGKTLVTSAADRSLRTWDTLTGNELEAQRWKCPRPSVMAFSPDGQYLAVGADDELWLRHGASGKITQQWEPQADHITSVAWTPDSQGVLVATSNGLVQRFRLQDAPLTAKQEPTDAVLRQWWNELAYDDGRVAHRCIQQWLAHPTVALAYLRRQVLVVDDSSAVRVQKLLADLDHDRFIVREVAMQELVRMGRSILPCVQQHLTNKLSPEARDRTDKIVTQLQAVPLTPSELRTLRSVEIVEQLGSSRETHALLEHWQSGGPHAVLTIEAKAALRRLRPSLP